MYTVLPESAPKSWKTMIMSCISIIYINLRRSGDGTLFVCSAVRVFGCSWVRLFVRLWIRSSLHSVRFGQLLRCSHKRIVNIIKVYIERNKRLYWLWKLWSGNILSRPTCSLTLLSVTSRHWFRGCRARRTFRDMTMHFGTCHFGTF